MPPLISPSHEWFPIKDLKACLPLIVDKAINVDVENVSRFLVGLTAASSLPEIHLFYRTQVNLSQVPQPTWEVGWENEPPESGEFYFRGF